MDNVKGYQIKFINKILKICFNQKEYLSTDKTNKKNTIKTFNYNYKL